MSDAPVTATPPPPPPAPAAAPPAPTRTLQVVHEDDDIVVEWTLTTPAVDTIAVTFDPISVGAQEPAYAAGFLQSAGVDTLCVRKKREHFYQPLSLQRFDEITGPVLERYARRLAYGSSLGAYSVLYFCRHGFETVISSSPRVSAHPRLGSPHWQERVPFRHEIFKASKPATSGAVIFYDPHDGIDRMLVDEEIRLAWPHATYMPVPYSGHPTNQFLSEIGFIAPFVRAVTACKPWPVLERRRHKARSCTYFHMLAVACLRHRKLQWTERLCQGALALKPGMTEVQHTYGQALLALGRLDEAEERLLLFQKHHPHTREVLRSLEALRRERTRREQQQRLREFAAQAQRAGDGPGASAAGGRAAGRTFAGWLKSRLWPQVDRDEVLWCYLHLLGREPESETAVQAHLQAKGLQALLQTFIGSAEYGRRLSGDVISRHRDRLVQTALLAHSAMPRGGRVLEVGPPGWFGKTVREVLDAEKPSNGAIVDLCVDTALQPRPPRDERALLYGVCQRLRPGGHVLWAGHWPALPDARPPEDTERLLAAAGLDAVTTVKLPKVGGYLSLARKPHAA